MQRADVMFKKQQGGLQVIAVIELENSRRVHECEAKGWPNHGALYTPLQKFGFY